MSSESEEQETTAPDTQTSAEFHRQAASDLGRAYRYSDRRFSGDARGILKELFNNMQIDLSITPQRWDRLMTKYLKGLPNTGKTMVEEKSSLNKNLVNNPNMTWVMFCRALKFLRVVRVRFSVTLSFYDRTTTEHGIWFNVNNPTHMSDEDAPGELAERVTVMRSHSDNPIANQPIIPTQEDVVSSEPLDLESFSRLRDKPDGG